MKQLSRLQKFFAVFCLVFSVAVFAAPAAQAEEPAQYVTVDMKADTDGVQPGKSFLIGFKQTIYPEWHTYWKNPGDTGAETRIKLTLPDGFTAGDILWQTPERVPYGDVFVNYGYAHEAYFLMEITPPAEITAKDVTITADKSWLVCKEICIPEDGQYSVTLPVKAAASPANTDVVAAARAHQPEEKDWAVTFVRDGENFVLTVPHGGSLTAGGTITFFPAAWGLIDNLAAQQSEFKGDMLTVTVKSGDRDFSEVPETMAVLRIDDAEGGTKAYRFTAKKNADNALAITPASGTASDTFATDRFFSLRFLTHLLLAMLGGMILNLMPCVFPVLSLKALSLVKHGDHGRGKAAMQGLSYTCGVVASFGLVAGALMVFQSFGAAVGWGFQLQNPYVILGLGALMFLIGLNLAGFFEITLNFGGAGASLTRGEGYGASFFTGVLATILATPCTAPFMAAAIGYALTQPAVQAIFVFLFMGLGLALPYLLLTLIPALRAALPRPGAWMERFRQFLAFPMFLTAVWLVWVLGQQAGMDAVFLSLAMFVALAWIIWLKDSKKKFWSRGFTLVLVAALFCGLYKLPVTPVQPAPGEIAYTQAALDKLLAADKPVLVNMTAAWCITCKVNERAVLKTDAAHQLFESRGITLVTGDWTRYDEAITAYLEQFQRRGVPLYVYYGSRNAESVERPAPKVLPQLLTPQILRNALDAEEK